MRVKSYFSNWLKELLMMTFRSKLYWHFHYELCCCIIPAPLNCRSIWPLPVIINGTHSVSVLISQKRGHICPVPCILYRLQLTVEFFFIKTNIFQNISCKTIFILRVISTSQHFCCDIEGTQNAKKDLSGGQGHTFWGTGQQSRKRLQKILTVASFRECVPLILGWAIKYIY